MSSLDPAILLWHIAISVLTCILVVVLFGWTAIDRMETGRQAMQETTNEADPRTTEEKRASEEPTIDSPSLQ